MCRFFFLSPTCTRWSENVKLANWTSTQRQEYKNKMKGKRSRLDDRRIQMLNDIGFSWELQRGGKKRRLLTSAEREDDDDDDDASSAASSSLDEEDPATSTSGSGRSDEHTEAGSSATVSGLAAPAEAAPTQNLTLSEQLYTQRMLNQIQEGLLQDARENRIRELIASSTNRAHAQPQSQMDSSALHTLLAQTRLQQSLLNGNLSAMGDHQLQALISMASSSQGANGSSYTQSSLLGNQALLQSLLSGLGNTGTTGHSSVGSLINNTNGAINSNNNHALRQALLGLTSSSSIGQPQSLTAGISAEALLQHALNTVQQQQQHSVSASSTNAFASLLALQSNQASSSQSNEEGKHQPE